MMSKEPNLSDQAENLRQRFAAERGEGPDRGGRPPLRVIAVTSGKGGVGKTNMSANLAVLAAKKGKRVLIIDADLGLANVEIVFGVKPRYSIADLLKQEMTIDEVMVEAAHGIKILPAGSGVQWVTKLEEAQKMQLLAALDPIEEQFDVVLVDSGAGIGDNVLFFVSAAQEALLVVSPEPTSLVDAYAVVKVLSQQAGVKHFAVVVNPVVEELPAREIFSKLTSVTSKFLTANMRHLGYVPRDENFHRAIMAQTPLVDLFPASPASRALTLIADKLFNEGPPPAPDGGLKFMWQRILRESSPPVRG